MTNQHYLIVHSDNGGANLGMLSPGHIYVEIGITNSSGGIISREFYGRHPEVGHSINSFYGKGVILNEQNRPNGHRDIINGVTYTSRLDAANQGYNKSQSLTLNLTEAEYNSAK